MVSQEEYINYKSLRRYEKNRDTKLQQLLSD